MLLSYLLPLLLQLQPYRCYIIRVLGKHRYGREEEEGVKQKFLRSKAHGAIKDILEHCQSFLAAQVFNNRMYIKPPLLLLLNTPSCWKEHTAAAVLSVHSLSCFQKELFHNPKILTLFL